MTHKEIFSKYKEISKTKDEDIIVWFPCGRNSVRIRPVKGVEFVFSYYTEQKWCLETIDKFIEAVNERKCKR